MKTIFAGLAGYCVVILLVTGCAYFRGGDSDTGYRNASTGTALSDDTEGVNTGSSPSMRPGMNPQDVRDSHAFSNPTTPEHGVP